ncbi:patatin-like phospholipase family protein [Endozoicomonas ascidiicola]|uniref:patatin-like phospholipase family protein n=1 Tax=Endozoicomonas ascidiicola TaxID=1698521 RepID=UPI0012FB9911|nr:patatin family protein [Endozoicomonas ascidiicola]
MNNTSPAKRALIVEGGGMRGVFTAGILDAFIDKRVPLFDGYFGVSSGALNLSAYLSGQKGLSLDLYTALCNDPDFISVRRHLKGGHLMDLDLFFQRLAKSSRFNIPAIFKKLQTSHFCVVTTDVETGKPVYHGINQNHTADEFLNILKASSALPVLYNSSVMINDLEMTDGSLSDPIPYRKAIADGFDQIVILRTRPLNFRKSNSLKSRFYAWKSREKPSIGQLIKDQDQIYNLSADFIEQLTIEDNVEILQIAPTSPLQTSRKTTVRNHLVADYHQGYSMGFALSEQLRTEQSLSSIF